MDDNEILARNDGNVSPLHLQADGGDLKVHTHQSGTQFIVKNSGKVGIGTDTPNVALHVSGDTDATLTDGSGLFVVGKINGRNLVMDDNEILARNNGNVSPLHLQAEGGDLKVHTHQSGTQFVVENSGKVGIGTDNPETDFRVKGNKSGSNNSPTDHIAFIENESTSISSGVLALRIGRSNPGPRNNFITFFADNIPIGVIKSNPYGNGVGFDTASCDFAEQLPKRFPDEHVRPGDVVGIHSGEVSLDTDRCHQAMIVSTSPAVIGNSTFCNGSRPSAPVAFVGQVPTRIRGKVPPLSARYRPASVVRCELATWCFHPVLMTAPP
jgi:hypothetical protein